MSHVESMHLIKRWQKAQEKSYSNLRPSDLSPWPITTAPRPPEGLEQWNSIQIPLELDRTGPNNTNTLWKNSRKTLISQLLSVGLGRLRWQTFWNFMLIFSDLFSTFVHHNWPSRGGPFGPDLGDCNIYEMPHRGDPDPGRDRGSGPKLPVCSAIFWWTKVENRSEKCVLKFQRVSYLKRPNPTDRSREISVFLFYFVVLLAI